MAYALLVEKTLAERQVVAILAAAGADVALPSVYELDVSLGLVERYDEDTREMREAVGLPT